MDRRHTLKLLASTPFMAAGFGSRAAENPAPAQPQKGAANPSRVILFLGDGMGFAHWQVGDVMGQEPLQISRFKHMGAVRINPVDVFFGDAPSHATAIATGVNSRKGAVGVDRDNKPLENIMEWAAKQRIATGLVSSNTLLEGSIAPFVAHTLNRMQIDDITAAYVDSPLNVVVGGARKSFTQRKDGRNIEAELRQKGCQILQSVDELATAPATERVLLFTAEDTVPSIDAGRGDLFPKSVRLSCERLAKQNDRFFLTVCNMYVDRASHAGNIDLVAKEVGDLDRAIAEAVRFADQDGNTLVVVVGGAEASGMTLVDFKTAENKLDARWSMPGMIHTGLWVPLFAYGPGAEQFQGLQSNFELCDKLKSALKQ